MVQARTWMAACFLVLAAACGGSDPITPPLAPTGVAATPGDGVVGVRWSATTGADGYTVYRSTSSGSGKAGTAVQVNATSLDQAGLTNGVTYFFVVTAVNAGGESPPSAEVEATPVPAFQPLTLSEAGTGGGTVTSAPAGIDCGATCAASFATGSTVTLTATPDATSNFAGWSGACTGTGACAPVMDGPRSVTATFTRITHEVTVVRAGTGGGAVTSSPAGIDCGATCAAPFDAGSLVTLTAAPDATSTFAGWTGSGCSGTGTCSVTVGAAATATATFTRNTHALTVARAGTGGGTVTAGDSTISCGATCDASYVTGTVVTLTATPAASSTFAGWGGACTGTGSCTVTMDAARSVDATFTLKSYALTVVRTGGGTVTSSPAGISCGATCSASYDHGTSVMLTATADPGATFAGWSAACSGTGTCTVTMDAAKVVTARFVYPVSVSLAGSGGGQVASAPAGINCGSSCAAPFDAGSLVTLTATPDATSTFTGWSGACIGTGTCAVTVGAAATATATFTRNTYALTVNRAGTGNGTVTSAPAGLTCGATCAGSYDAGTQVTLTAAPDVNSTFAGWSVASCPGTGTCTVSIDAATSVTATFTRIARSLSVTRSGIGTGSVTSSPAGIDCGTTCAATFPSGLVVTLTATPAASSTFTGWSGSGCTGTGTCVVVMDGSKSVTATFTLKSYALTAVRTGGGTVTSSPAGISCGATCSANFNHGTVVNLTPTADPGATFAGWSAACSGTGTCTVTMDAAKVVTARFVYPVSVSLAGSGGGQVTSAPAGISCGSACSATFDGGTQVTLTATPDATSSFGGWTGVDSAAGTTATVNLNAAKFVTASFIRNNFTLTVTRSGAGTGTVASVPAGIDCGATCSASYASETAVTLTAVPSGASTFTGWSGACAGTGNCTVLMSSARTVTATFGP